MKMKYRLPVGIKKLMLKMKGKRGFNNKTHLKQQIDSFSFVNKELTQKWRKNLYALLEYGKLFEDFITNFIKTTVTLKKHAEIEGTVSEPTVVCVVKNDLMRMQLFYEHYRNLGVKHFAVLDDNSDDGTREFLLAQNDTDVFVSDSSYTTVIRQVWLNKMTAMLGDNHWYIVVDSDELLVYKNCENKGVSEVIAQMENDGYKAGEALLIDMFSKNGLFDDSIKSHRDIPQVYTYFCNNYYMDPSMFAPRIKGGFRASMFQKNELQTGISAPVVSKYPIIFLESSTILINSHYCFPFNLNYTKNLKFGLLHYKFLPGDQKKYEERRKKGNFGGGSAQYQIYDSKKNIAFDETKMEEYKNSDSLDKIELLVN